MPEPNVTGTHTRWVIASVDSCSLRIYSLRLSSGRWAYIKETPFLELVRGDAIERNFN